MDVQQRIEDYRRQLAEDPDSRVFAPLAELLHQTGRTEEALSLLADGVVRHPQYLSAQVIQARLYLATGQRKRAANLLRSILGRDGQNVVVLSLLTDEYLAAGQEVEAAELLRKLVTLDPDQSRWRRELQRLESTGRIALPGRDGFATMTLVDICIRQGYQRRALAALYTILAREPDRRDVQMRIAELEAVLRTGHEDADGPAPGGAGAMPHPASGDTRPRDGGDSVQPGSVDDTARRRADRRAREKRRFTQWLESFDAQKKDEE